MSTEQRSRRSKFAALAIAISLVGADLLIAAPAMAAGGDSSSEVAEYTVSINGITYDDSPQFSAQLAAPGCSASDSQDKRVNNWQRRRPDGVAKLVCGNNSFGWRHIASRHGGDWQRIVTNYNLGRSWDDFAKWAVGVTVGAPASAPVNASNNTWTYQAPVQIRNNNGQVVRTYTVRVPVSRSNERIITAFPS